MRAFVGALSCAAALTSIAAFAHGPQIQITNNGNKIVTRQVFLDGPYATALTNVKSVYVIPIEKVVTGSPSTDYWTILPDNHIDSITQVTEFQYGPGLAYGIGHTFAANVPTSASYHFNVNFADSLKKWDGASTFVDNPGPEEIGAFRGDSTTAADQAVTTDSAPYQGLVFNNIAATYGAEAHSSMRFRMRGDGLSALVEPSNGIYLLKLQITSTQDGTDGLNPALAPSDVFSFVLHKGVTGPQLSAAVASLGVAPALVQFVPEPGAAALTLLAACAMVVSRRRTRSVRS
jgi:hypothetical protein